MTTISFVRHQFPPAIIRYAVWLYIRFTLGFRDVEDLLAERGMDVSYETVRRWVLKFWPSFARLGIVCHHYACAFNSPERASVRRSLLTKGSLRDPSATDRGLRIACSLR
jgi:transposase-like protein